jgi:hypothetical protein
MKGLHWKIHLLTTPTSPRPNHQYFARLYKSKKPQLLATSAYKSEQYLRSILEVSGIPIDPAEARVE